MASRRSQSVIVWEWETNENGIFVPYDELASNFIEKEFAFQKTTVDLSQLGPSYSAWTVDLSSMTQSSSFFGRKRAVRRKSYPNDSLIACGIIWEFIGDLGWEQFDVRASSVIEDSYNAGETSADMKKINGLEMIIDFTSMVVRNFQTSSVKRIRRRMAQVPYIGGSVGPLPKSQVAAQQMLLNKAKRQAAKTSTATSQDGKIIVWEWETDLPGIFAPYSENDSNLIEMENVAGKKVVRLSPNGVLDVQVNLNSMKAMMNRFGRERAVRRTLYSKDVPLANKVSWEWMGDLDWQLFHVETATVIEDHYKKGNTELDFRKTPLRIPNTLSFTMMQQKNEIYGTIRKVRRRVMNTSYVEERNILTKSRSVVAKYDPTIKNIKITRNQIGLEKEEEEEAVSFSRGKELEIDADSDICSDEDDFTDSESEEVIGAQKVVTAPKTYRLLKIPITNAALKNFCSSCDSVEEDDDCSICLAELRHPSETYGAASGNSVVELNDCHHKFHECCLEQYYESGNKDGSMQCPICKTIHGRKTGNQPAGTMTVQRIHGSLPGHNGYGVIQITYSIQPGIQVQGHPNPGQPYHLNGFPRVAFLPDSAKGRQVLQLLQEAWNRKLIFTVGTSVTSGMQNAVVWNEIHHKTEAFANSSGHGYPDPNYLDNVLQELKAQGVQ